MANLLALLQGLVNPQQQPTGDATVDEITVSPRKRLLPVVPPQPTAQNPFTPDYLVASQQAQQAQGQLPRVSGGTDAGLYGFAPQGLQNGRLRDILGAIGDGLLLSGGHKQIYQPRVDERRQGQALIGYDANPNAAIERMAQTGSPGSVDDATGLLKNLQTTQERAANRQMQADYHTATNQARVDANLQRASSIVPGILARAKTPEDYAAAYDRIDKLAKRIDPQATPETAFGLPRPEDWTPESTAWVGTTGGQQIGADTARESIAQRRESAGMSHQDRQASIAQRTNSSGMAHSDRQASLQLRRDTAKNKAANKPTTAKQATGRLTAAQASKLPPGTVFTGTDGRQYRVPKK